MGTAGHPATFGLTLVPVLRELYQEILDQEDLAGQMRHGATRLKPKVAGCPAVNELRPITLLNTDYKILTGILARRVLRVLQEVLTSGQLCSVKGMSILTGAMEMMAGVSYLDKHPRTKAALISLDFWKAFDRVLVSFLEKVMKAMGFPKKFINWVTMCHKGATTRFLLKNMTRGINVAFSLRQGDPLALVLYLIYIEPLLQMIRKRLRGIRMGPARIVHHPYVDDENIWITKERDLKRIDEMVAQFESASGAILSRTQKCKILGFGPWKKKVDWPLEWIQTVKEAKQIGLMVCQSLKQTTTRSWDDAIGKMRKQIGVWSTRDFPTLWHREKVVSTYITSKLWYRAAILPLPRGKLDYIESKIGSFLWLGPLERVRKGTSNLTRRHGGLGLPRVSLRGKSVLGAQVCRILGGPASQQMSQLLAYWAGDVIYKMPWLVTTSNSLVVPKYFKALNLLLLELSDTMDELSKEWMLRS